MATDKDREPGVGEEGEKPNKNKPSAAIFGAAALSGSAAISRPDSADSDEDTHQLCSRHMEKLDRFLAEYENTPYAPHKAGP